MEIRHFDYVVIGGGSAGYAAARTARETFENVAIIDGAANLGGLCILRGCMPSKTLIYSTEVLHLAQRPGDFGLAIPEARVDMAALQRRKQAVIAEFADYREGQLRSDRFTLIRDRAKFIDANTVALTNGSHIRADHFMIATGSVVNTPDVPGLADTPHWDSDDVLDLDFLPASVIVLGGGTVACELAQFLRRAGSPVTLVQRSGHLLKETSPEASEVIAKVFREEGMTVHLGTDLTGVSKEAEEIVVKFKSGSASHEVRAAYLFNALGRKPATAHLGLDAAGVEVDKCGLIQVDEFQQTANRAIHAGGDVTGPHEIVHLAVMQGELAAKHACGLDARPIDYDQLTSVIFTDPQVASAGIPQAKAKERGLDLATAEYPFDDHGKSILMGAKHGHVKVWADRATGKVIGAECVGKDGGELIHSMAVAITLGATATDLLKVQWYHPTLSEIWSYPLEEIVEAR